MQRANKEARADEEHQRHRHLRDHENLAQFKTAAATGQRWRLTLERRGQVRARGLQRRRQPEQQACQHSHRMEFERGSGLRQKTQKETVCPKSEHEAEHGSEQR